MTTVIVGAGAMGCVFAALMVEGNQDVLLYDVDSEKIAQIKAQGISIIKNDTPEQTINVPTVDRLPEVADNSLFILLVKSPHTERAAREVAAVAGQGAAVLTLQNGFGNIDQIRKYFADQHIFAGVTYQSATELAAGKVFHTGAGMTIIAPVTKESMPRAMEIARLFNNCAIAAGATNDIDAMSWKKLIINSAINPLAALYGVKNGQLQHNPEIVRDMAALVVEGVAVAQACGVPLDYGEIWASVLDTCRRTADNTASMLADVQAGRVTEIHAINGSIADIGETHGVDTPTNLRMLRSVVAIHGGRNR